MAHKRPCRICRKWFRPHPRNKNRQSTCSDPSCQRERHRRASASWRRRNPDYDREDRFRRRLLLKTNQPGAMANPLQNLNWSAARSVVGFKTAVVIEETGQLLVRWTRDAVRRQPVTSQSHSP